MNQHDMIAAIGSLFPTAQFQIDFTIKTTNEVPALLTWNNALGEQPTQQQIQAALDAIQLSGYQRLQSTALEEAYQNATFATAIAYMGTTFWADADSKSKVLGLLVVYGNSRALPDGFMFWDATNRAVTMTFAEMEGLGMAIAERETANFIRRKTLLASIASATTASEVQSISW